MLRFPLKCTYLLPNRRRTFSNAEAEKFARYFQVLTDAGSEVLVIDGSPRSILNAHAAIWSHPSRHLPVDARFTYRNDKVNAIHTGADLAGTEKIIIGDDDIRYDAEAIASVCRRLQEFEVVRSQNFIDPLLWWARMLINRATLKSGDYSGTCGFRRSAMLRAGHYDGDVLFDNEEMIRNFARAGLTVDYPSNLFIRKDPPSFCKWLEQRPRQACEDFALLEKTFFFVVVIPSVIFLALVAGWKTLLFSALALSLRSIMLAAARQSMGKARTVFAFSNRWFAPLWIAERATSIYCAFCWYLLRGGYFGGGRCFAREWAEVGLSVANWRLIQGRSFSDSSGCWNKRCSGLGWAKRFRDANVT